MPPYSVVYIGATPTFVITFEEESDTTPGDFVAVDLSEATSLALKIRKHDGTILTVTPTLYTDGTDGKVTYRLPAADCDVRGKMTVKGEAQWADGEIFRCGGEFGQVMVETY